MRIGMFVTPIFWTHAPGDSIRAVILNWNPFTYFLEIVRAPIVDGRVPLHALAVCGSISPWGLWAVAVLLLGRYRRQIVFVI